MHSGDFTCLGVDDSLDRCEGAMKDAFDTKVEGDWTQVRRTTTRCAR